MSWALAFGNKRVSSNDFAASLPFWKDVNVVRPKSKAPPIFTEPVWNKMPLERSDDFASVGVVSTSMIESSPKRESSEKSEKSVSKYVRSRHASLKALTRPFLGFVLNPKSEDEPPKSWSSDWEKPCVKIVSEIITNNISFFILFSFFIDYRVKPDNDISLHT